MNTHRLSAAFTPILVGSALLLTGCSGFTSGGAGGSGTLASDVHDLAFKASLPTRAYTYQDKNTADIYLTDLSNETLTNFFENDTDWTQISGSMVHVHLFLNPKPGRTPIEPTAANATVRYIIITQGEIGIYDGAGFILPGKKIGKDSISGTLHGAPAALTRKTDGFNDILGTTRMDLSFSAKLDHTKSNELRARVDALSATAESID